MVEQAIIFSLGFLLAALLAVLTIPIVSRRAARLAERRAAMRSPLSEAQVLAERDAIRAQHAVEQFRAEERAAAAADLAANFRTEVGRLSVANLQLEALVAKFSAELEDRRQELERREIDMRELRGAFGASQVALLDLTAQRDRSAGAEAQALSRQAELEAQAARERASIAMLTARAEKLGDRLAEAQRAGEAAAAANAAERDKARLALTAQADEARRLESFLREAREQNRILAAELAQKDTMLGQAQRRLREVEEGLAQSERGREETLLENSRQFALLADRDAALRKTNAILEDLSGRHAQLVISARERENAAAQDLQSSRTALAAAEGSLRVARADREKLMQENDHLRGRLASTGQAEPSAEVAALRGAISRLGRDFLTRLRAAAADDHFEDDRPADLFAFARRETAPRQSSGAASEDRTQSQQA